MSDGRKHASVTEEAFDALDAHRREDESWSELYLRAAKALDGDVETDPETDLDDIMDRLDELAVSLPADAASEVENRLRTR